MDRKTAAKTLREIARLLEVSGENPHRIRAFTGASRAIETIDGDLAELIADGSILEVRGIGKGTAAVLAELAAGDRPAMLVEAESKVPAGVRQMLGLRGLGPKKVRALWRELGLETLGELEYACRENRLVDLKGFGPKTQQSVLSALDFRRGTRDRRLLHQAWAAVGPLMETVAAVSGVVRVEPAGELRRMTETVGELALVAALSDGTDPKAVAGAIGAAEPFPDGAWLASADDGPPVRLHIASPADFGLVLLRATGSEDFVAAIDGRLAANAFDAGSTATEEAAIFDALDLQRIPPELRDDPRWIEAAAGTKLPELVELDDIRGVLHNHTTDSDGVATLEEMAGAAAERGWSFFGVADHSPAAHYANGVDADRLRTQWKRADAWNAANPDLRIVKGLEADILGDGGLDIPAGCADGLDYVVASVHSSFRLAEEVQTERIVAAVEHRACKVLGHPTGRLLLARPGYAVDVERVLEACAEHDVAVEINASPYRLDLDAEWARRALDLGLKLVVNPDAHSIDGLDDVRWGLAVARRAGATASDLVNCMDIADFIARR